MSTQTGGFDELSSTLKQLRRTAGLSGHDAGSRAGFSQAKISRIEAGKNVPSPDDVRILARLYGASPAEVSRLIAIARAVQPTSRRIVLSRHPNRAAFQARIGEIEASSEQIREFTPTVVPGLLQTREYIASIWASSGGPAAAGLSFVAARLERQAVLADKSKRITLIATEGALGWAAGPPTLMTRQCEHLAAQIDEGVRFGVIPFGTPVGTFPTGGWSLYDERAVIPSVLAVQTILTPPDVAPYVAQWAALEPHAVFGDEAKAVINRVEDRYRQLA